VSVGAARVWVREVRCLLRMDMVEDGTGGEGRGEWVQGKAIDKDRTLESTL
jgi:hypothetical protein